MITLVPASAVDAEALLTAKIDAFAPDVALYGFGPPDYDSLADTRRALCHPKNHYFKIDMDGLLAGGLCAHDMGGGHFHLNSIYVFTNRQNCGAGSAAMRLLFGIFPAVGRWTLETPHLSLRNHHFYEKLGFVRTGETAPGPDGFRLFLYEKTM